MQASNERIHGQLMYQINDILGRNSVDIVEKQENPPHANYGSQPPSQYRYQQGGKG
jgi:hypothetical protein